MPPRSQGVAPQLQSHVHLISAHRFPQVANLDFQQAFRYLIDAPTIVKQHAPMSWQYVPPPPDGTMWLEWIPLDKNDHPYPSDGYVWGDMEQSYRQEIGGYTLELRMQAIGYRPGQDQMATHARTRYHFVAKNPSVNAAPPDPSLWLVHYHSAQPSQIMPASQLPVSNQMQNTIAQRRWLESQGRLERRDFMLHDREHWPVLNIPSHAQAQQSGQYAQAHTQNRYPAYPQSASQAGGPPAKRPRTSGPGMPMPGSSDGAQDNSLEIEEDTALGDFFDHLTQRDISMARYTQHHRWMEEVFSSPYASSHIVPADLGLGLMGELKGLTEGILEPPSIDVRESAEPKPAKAKEAEPFTNLKKEQVDEFSKRVAKHLEEGQAELERMKAEHAVKMQDWKKVKSLTLAEKRLRYAKWAVHEDEISAYRLEVEPALNGHVEEGLGKENVDDVVKEVEEMLKIKINSHPDATRVAKGGFQERKQPVYFEQPPAQQDGANDGSINATQQQTTSTSTPAAGNGEGATFHEDPMATAQSVDAQRNTAHAPQQAPPQPTSHFGSNQPTSNAMGNTPQAGVQDYNIPGTGVGNTPGLDINDMMDMDVDEHIDFGDTPTQDFGSVDNGGSSMPSAQQGQHPTSGSAETTGAGAGSTNQRATADTGHDMFNDDTFGDLTNIDNGDDGLIDFDAGDMFGDAMHGMDQPGGSGNTPAGDGS